ncbi:uncharacterized protein DNG_07034 [Cephalotrichum gorgonifer]|uniref:Uncharacterized protein n=1 Tax=Cephalotrichum gorgonifer TaxID=2041049 RepID=A0AAE8SX48_9PEZI|nr:uncharacterized protein DNG_07034 [Cephalotrichum gorgonifer]
MAYNLPCPSWVWSNNSNVHAAKDRYWFSADYQPLNSTVTSYILKGSGSPVVRIGTVELPVKRSPRATGARAHGILRLRNVLHVPTATCNVIGNPILDEYRVTMSGSRQDTKGAIVDRRGRNVANFDPRAILFQVRLSGPPVGPRVGPSPFDPSILYMINVRWPDSERDKWEASRGVRAPQAVGVTPLSDTEKRWFIEHWGGEFKFLASYGLSFYKEKDREVGRVILRAILSGSGGSDNSNGDKSEASLAVNTAQSVGIAPLSKTEKSWLKEHWGSEFRFLLCHGLSIYEEEDREEGRTILRAIMDGSDGRGSSPLSDTEEGWLKEHWDGEFEFLLCHGLQIYKEEDREEGRAILRAIMDGRDSDDDEDGGNGWDYNGWDSSDDDRSETQLADSYFDADELRFIRDNYGGSTTFMFAHGLKFYDPEAGEEAQSIFGKPARLGCG